MNKNKYKDMTFSESFKNKDYKLLLGWLWWFIWESNSIWSWIINIILAFVIIKFLVYPGLGFIFQTSHPIVAVVSESMEHDGNFDQWWNSKTALCTSGQCTQKEFYAEYNIDESQFKDFIFKNGFNKGDIMILKGAKPENIKIGDVLVFISSRDRPRADPIIHRIIEIKEEPVFSAHTKGDNNRESIDYCSFESCLDEFDIIEKQFIGKAIIRIPYLGYIKILFVDFINLIRKVI